jgi:hypothetical protein
MRNFLFFLIVTLAFGCASTLKLQSSQVAYEREGLGRESPQEIANADYTMAMAEAVRKDPDLLKWGYGYGYGGFGSNPCYYYPDGACPMAMGGGGGYVTEGEVMEMVDGEFAPLEKKIDTILEKAGKKGGGK